MTKALDPEAMIESPEETLRRLVAQLEVFYQERFESDPPRPEQAIEEVAEEAEGLAARLELLARENGELEAGRRSLEARCRRAEQREAELERHVEDLASQVDLLERERNSLAEACDEARQGLLALEREHASVVERTEELLDRLRTAEEAAEAIACPSEDRFHDRPLVTLDDERAACSLDPVDLLAREQERVETLLEALGEDRALAEQAAEVRRRLENEASERRRAARLALEERVHQTEVALEEAELHVASLDAESRAFRARIEGLESEVSLAGERAQRAEADCRDAVFEREGLEARVLELLTDLESAHKAPDDRVDRLETENRHLKKAIHQTCERARALVDSAVRDEA